MAVLTRLNKYELQLNLGSGGFGTVWRARDTVLDRIIALKIINTNIQNKDKVLREARLLANLNHSNIVVVHNADYDDVNKCVFIEMEYAEQTLAQILDQEGRLDFDRAYKFISPVLEALEYAHGKKVVHRDIKAANILVSKDETVKLGDFGIAQEYADGLYLSNAGTFSHMAPENFAEKPSCDHRSDLWSAGYVLYQLLTGQQPFSLPPGASSFAWSSVYKTQQATPLNKYITEVPNGLQEILDRALTVNKYERYASAREFADELLRLSVNMFMQKAGVGGVIPSKSLTVPIAMPGSAITDANIAASGHFYIQRDEDGTDGVTIEVIKRAWLRILKTFQKASPVGIRFLEKSEPVRLQGKHIALAFKDKSSRDIIASNQKGRALVEQAINLSLQTNGYKIRCILATEQMGLLEEALNIFGGEVVRTEQILLNDYE